MKKFLAISFLIFLSCSSDDNSSPEPNFNIKETVLPTVSGNGFKYDSEDLNGWSLIWEDNFDNDLSDWNVWKGGSFNGELQFYQPDNLYLDKGYLFIEQLKESVTGVASPTTTATKSFDFTSGRIETKELYNPSVQGTLRISARIKLPHGDGIASEFWNDGDPWPTQGEIKTMEFKGDKLDQYVTNFYYGLEPEKPLNDPKVTGSAYYSSIDLTQEFHIFDLVWSENSLVFSMDGEEIRTIASAEFPLVSELFTKNQQIVLNLAVGGAIFEGENLDYTKIPDKSYLIVDWVGVYTKAQN